MKKTVFFLTLSLIFAYFMPAKANNSEINKIAVPKVSQACHDKVREAEQMLAGDNQSSYEGAAHAFDRAVEIQYDCVPALIGYTQALTLARGNELTYEEYLKAYEYITRAMVFEPDNPKAYWVLANLMRYANRPLAALELADHSLVLNPNDPWAHYVYGSLLIVNQPKIAIVELQKALEIKPGWRRAQQNLAAAYLSNKQYKDAENILLELVEFDKLDTYAWTNLGIAHFRMGKIDQSIEDFNTALKSNPNFPMALKGLGDSAMAKKDYETAVNSFRSYLDIYPNDSFVLKLLGQALEANKDFAAAREAYTKVLQLSPEDEETRKKLEALPQ